MASTLWTELVALPGLATYRYTIRKILLGEESVVIQSRQVNAEITRENFVTANVTCHAKE